MKLTQRQQQAQPEQPEVYGPELRRRTERAQLWRVDWKRHGYDFCGIYCISPDNRWPTKVGVSQNPNKRLISLQTACWKRLDIAEYRYAKNGLEAREVEKRAHLALAADGKLMEGEWFDIRPEKAMEVIEFTAISLGVELRSDVPDERVRLAILEQERVSGRRMMAEVWGEASGKW